MVVRSRYIVAVVMAAGLARTGEAASIADSNQAKSPPLTGKTKGTCEIDLIFKPALPIGEDQHAFLVITGPAGQKVEVRGGPANTRGSGPPVGNPFGCVYTKNFGVVAPYIGPHGLLGKDADGNAVYSPDGNVAHPTRIIGIGSSADKGTCARADCIMTVMSAAGKSCEAYTAGTGELRNSNTILSFALASCGVKDPLPSDIDATGWGNRWGR